MWKKKSDVSKNQKQKKKKKIVTGLHVVERALSPWENNKKLFAPVSNLGPLTKMAGLAEVAA